MSALRRARPLHDGRGEPVHRAVQVLARAPRVEHGNEHRLGELSIVRVGRESATLHALVLDEALDAVRAEGLPERLEAWHELRRVAEGIADGGAEHCAHDALLESVFDG